MLRVATQHDVPLADEGWTNLVTDHLAGGSSSGQLRSYAEKLTRGCRAAAVSHVPSTITATTMALAAGEHPRCADCATGTKPARGDPRVGLITRF